MQATYEFVKKLIQSYQSDALKDRHWKTLCKQEQPPLRRKKIENLISEYVHKRSVLRLLIKNKADNNKDFEWLRQMRFYYDPKQTDVLKQLCIHMANAKFQYGFEYLGVQEKLVQTPLNYRCYLTMTQALEARLSGSPFGPERRRL